VPKTLRAPESFDDAPSRPLRRGKKAPLRVNPEPLGFTRGLEFVERQTQAFRPGSRRVDFRALEKLLEPWAGRYCQERSEPAIRVKLIDMETETTKICSFDDAKTWDWSNPLTLRLIDGRHINSLDRFTEILKYKIDKGCEEVEVYEGPRFMLLAGG
jgi:hypothetical protein